jgi:two-component system cell cycle sensor histidine kinase/response regulator CckA
MATRPTGSDRLDAFFTAAPAGLAILDRELRYVQLNETLALMNGRAVADHVGKPLRDVLPTIATTLEPMLQRILETGEPALNIELSGETPAQPGVTRYWRASLFPLAGPARRRKGDGNGGPVGIGAIVVEDTPRRHAERALRRSGADYRAMVEQATYGIYRSSLEGRFLKVNPALVEMLGYDSESQILALDLDRDVYVESGERARIIKNASGLDRVTGVEVQWKRKDGHRIIVRLSGRVVRGEKGDVKGFEMMADDVTEQRTLERALQQAQKMETIGRLTSGIAHDFNNLLTVILAQSNLIAKALPPEPPPEVRRDLDELTEAARRGAELVHRLLGFSRHEILDLRPLSAPEWVNEELHTLRRLLPATIEIQCDAEPEAGVVQADAGALEQILLNLATNARDAMPRGGTLHLDVRRTRLDAEDRPLHAWVEPGSYVCIAVSDTGAGMDANTQARVFEPFFTTKPAGVGTGLGMAMVYGLVKQHKGFVHLYSEVGQGTTVKVYLPLVLEEPLPARAVPDTDTLPGGTEAILLVEDDVHLRTVAQRLFEKVGYRVLAAADGAEGLEAYRARASEIDLVITDLVMPKTSGLTLYETIRREQGSGPAAKILFTSGYPAPDFRESVAADPAVAFVTKPWTASELLRQIRGLLERRA